MTPQDTNNRHLSASEWHERLSDREHKVVIDTRNRYETMAGKFRGAIDPNLASFTEFSDFLDDTDLPKDVPVYMYCTGGIRCEKAILDMQSRGFEKVYQLRDGILGYLAEFPNGLFEGECFVFDDRVALDQHLQPTERFGTCTSCGLTAQQRLPCLQCRKEYFMCESCISTKIHVCSKTCLDRHQRGSRLRG